MSLLEFQGVFAALVVPSALLVAWLVIRGDRAQEALEREQAEARLRAEVATVATGSEAQERKPH